jgi:hypothetical protein
MYLQAPREDSHDCLWHLQDVVSWILHSSPRSCVCRPQVHLDLQGLKMEPTLKFSMSQTQ